MNQLANPTPHADDQSASNLTSKLAAFLAWLLRDMCPLPRWPVTLILAICISVAIGTSGYLLWAHVTSSPIAGCGSGGGWIDCEGVANSRWSVWFGIPVSLLALATYVAMALVLVVANTASFSLQLRKIGWAVVTAVVFAAGMSAFWFIAIQLLILQHICLYCMLAHACGLIATVTMLVAGPLRAESARAIAMLSFAGLMVLAAGQMLGHPPETYQIERFDVPVGDGLEDFEFAPPPPGDGSDERETDNLFEAPATSIRNPSSTQRYARLLTLPSALAFGVIEAASSPAEQSTGRVAAIQGGAIKLKVADWPHIGPSDAKYVIVELFDYCCPPCRETFKAIRGAQSQLGDELAIVLLTVPLSSDCNPMIEVTGARYKESCDLSKLAVAMWRLDPKAFASLHVWMLEGEQAPSYAKAIAKAKTLVDPEKLDAELASGVPDQFIARHVSLYKRVGGGSIPKLMFPRSSVVGTYTSVDGLVNLIRREGK